MKELLGVWIAVFGVSVSQARECSSFHSETLGRSSRYCLHRGSENPVGIVYFFHGVGGGAQSFWENGYEEVVLDRRYPLWVVSFDSSEFSFFSDAQGRRQGPRAFESFLIRDLIPFVEGKHFGKLVPRKRRYAWGVSMGGYGALKTALRHSSIFSVVAANVPALQPFNIHDSDSWWRDYFGRHPIGPWRGRAFLSYLREVHVDSFASDTNDPSFLLGDFEDEAARPRIWLDAAGQDYFGFQEGYFRFLEVARRRHWPVAGYFSPNAPHELFWESRWPSFDYLWNQARELIQGGHLLTVIQKPNPIGRASFGVAHH